MNVISVQITLAKYTDSLPNSQEYNRAVTVPTYTWRLFAPHTWRKYATLIAASSKLLVLQDAPRRVTNEIQFVTTVSTNLVCVNLLLIFSRDSFQVYLYSAS